MFSLVPKFQTHLYEEKKNIFIVIHLTSCLTCKSLEASVVQGLKGDTFLTVGTKKECVEWNE